MRKIVASVGSTLLLAGATALPAAAQAGGALVFKIGLNDARVSFSDNTQFMNTSTRTGLVGGASVRFPVAFGFAIEPELLYSQQGFQAEGGGVTSTFALNYLQLPVLAKVVIPSPSTLLPVFYAGTSVSFEVSCSISAESGSSTTTSDCDTGSDLSQRNTVDFGILFGGGFDFGDGPLFLTVDARYYVGFVNIDDSGVPNQSARNRVFAILVGAGFKLAS